MQAINWRKRWFEYVSKIKKKKKISHKEAMSVASGSWPKEKKKQERKHAKEVRLAQKQVVIDTRVKKTSEVTV